MPIDLGTNPTAEWVRGEAAAQNAVTLTVTRPDGATATPDVTYEDGTFSATLAATLPGRYLLAWADADDNLAYTDTVEVWPGDPRFLISFDDAVHALQWRTADVAAYADDLRLYIAAATPIIEDIAGAILVRTVVDIRDGGRIGVTLSKRPSEITSVEVNDIPITGYVVNERAQIVYRGRYDELFERGRQIVKVTYKTGSAEIPPNIQLGTRELVRHLWQIGQQIIDGKPIEYGDRPMGLTPSGFAVPKRVIELCSATAHRMPGIA